MKLTCEEACSSLTHPIQKERSKALRNVENWLSIEEQARALTFDELKQLFGACVTCLYLTDGIKEQRMVSVAVVKLTRKSFNGQADGFAALLLGIAEFWEHIDCHRVPKFLLLIRIIVAEILFQVLASNFDDTRCAQLYGALWLINPIVKIPDDHEISWLSKDQIRGCSQTPAIILQVFSVWFEEIAKQLGGKIHINQEETEKGMKKLRAERSTEIVKRSWVTPNEFLLLCYPLFRCLACYGQAENIWSRFASVVGDLEQNEDLFIDQTSQQSCFYIFGRCLEALVAAGKVTERNADCVNKLRILVGSKSGYSGDLVEDDSKIVSQWATTSKVVPFSC